MKPPKRIQVGQLVYRIRVGGPEFARAVADTQAPDLTGYCDHKQQHILLDPTLGPDAQRETLWHEIQHAVAFAAGGVLDLGFPDTAVDREEFIIRVMSPWQMMVLRDNPDLVDYLTD